MRKNKKTSPDVVCANVRLGGDDFSMSFRVTVPAGPTTVGELLPFAQALSDAIVNETTSRVKAAGEKISCTSGCSACCRSFVAITQAEARQIRDLIATLPQNRRTAVEARFKQVQKRLDEAGLLKEIEAAESWTSADYQAMVSTYFQLGLACPFLEDELCSIYRVRPITCREYLVTSPARHCAEQDSAGVRRVTLPLHVFHAVARWQAHATDEGPLEPWVPLIVAQQWAEAHPDVAPVRTGPELLKALLNCMKEYK
jgi:Fe-S-cluster containining protein